jgi:hypothetical protein
MSEPSRYAIHSDGSDASQADDEDHDSDNVGKRSGKVQYKTPVVPALPTEQGQLRSFMLSILEAVDAVSPKRSSADRDYFREVREIRNSDDPRLYHVEKSFVPLDRVFLPKLVKMCDHNVELRSEVLQERLLCENKRKLFTARKVLHMVFQSFSTDRCALEQVTITTLMAVEWKAPYASNAQSFHNRWLDVLSRLNEEIPGEHKMSLLWAQIRKCAEASTEAKPWRRKPETERTYEELWQHFKTYLNDVKDDQRYDRLLDEVPKAKAKPTVNAAADGKKKKTNAEKKADKAKAQEGSSNAPQNVADVDGNVAAAKDGNPKGKGKGDGKSKGKKPKMICLNYQTKYNGGTTCRYGDKCKYLHEECASKEAFEELAARVNSSDSDVTGIRDARRAVQRFVSKFCKFGSGCTLKDSTCKRDHSKSPEQWRQEKSKLDADVAKISK